MLQAELELQFFVYGKNGTKIDEFKVEKSFAEALDGVLKIKEIVFTFPYHFEAGRYYLDVIIIGKDGTLGKTRKIFDLKI